MEVKIDIKDGITSDLKRIQKELATLPKQALDKYVSLTPIDGGNARRKTKLRGKDTISANYAYAGRLDEGYSKQSPEGMTKPWEKWLEKKVDDIMDK